MSEYHTPGQTSSSDLLIAAQYADLDMISPQLSSTLMEADKVDINSATEPTGVVSSTDTETEEGEISNAEDAPMEENVSVGSDNESEHEEDDDEEEEDTLALRAEIEACMEKDESSHTAPPKTAHEVALPIKEVSVELTSDCPIAKCGTILNVSKTVLMVTIKSDRECKPLDEGSVLCFEDRTVLGCVDEVFGPVLMPMYLVRFESAEKIPSQTKENLPVYYATEHTTYIIPENIKDKGTDASNLYDEETDEQVFSDDEAEAAAKRRNQNRKRDRSAQKPQSQVKHLNKPQHGGRGGRVGGFPRPMGQNVSYFQPQHDSAPVGGFPLQYPPPHHGGMQSYNPPPYYHTGPAAPQFQPYHQHQYQQPPPGNYLPSHVGWNAPQFQHQAPPLPPGPAPPHYNQHHPHQHHPHQHQPQLPLPLQQGYPPIHHSGNSFTQSRSYREQTPRGNYNAPNNYSQNHGYPPYSG
jgi:H/ACA ribonucleoprotein complex non-core subunit NAF1